MRTELKGDIAELRGKLKRIDTLIKVLIGLVILTISFFSPAGTELIKPLK